MKKLQIINMILTIIVIFILAFQAGWFNYFIIKVENKEFNTLSKNEEKVLPDRVEQKVSEEQKLPDKWELKDINLEMVKCPAGSFMMGSPENELRHWSDETLHKVTITKPFYIGKYEVTQSQYEKIMGKNPSKFKNFNNPVENVSYDDSKNFCDKLNMKYKGMLQKGYIFDLPTEAQWEYACRAGTTTGLNNGKNLTTEDGVCSNLEEVAWYNKNSDKRTHSIGQKKPNAWGIYDMHGNVWEWCKDWYGKYTREDVKDPTGVNSGSSRVFRGGSWHEYARACRSANRVDFSPDYRGDGDIGFRVALVPVD